jgi:hypothetical protein
MAVRTCRVCGFDFVVRYSGPGRPRERCYSCQPENTKWVGKPQPEIRSTITKGDAA